MGYRIGGLLGEDSNADVSTPPSETSSRGPNYVGSSATVRQIDAGYVDRITRIRAVGSTKAADPQDHEKKVCTRSPVIHFFAQ